MNIKSLLLGSAAALVAVTGARAADVIVPVAPDPVDYVRVCDVYGKGFFYIPGTETCLSIGGYVRFKYAVIGDTTAVVNDEGDDYQAGSQVRVRLNFDAREETELGTLRGYARVQATNAFGTGSQFGSSGTDQAYSMDQGYIQLGGLTMGYLDTLWTDGDGLFTDTDLPVGDFQVNRVSYTYAANSFSAAVSLEDDGTGDFAPDVVARIAYDAGFASVYFAASYDERTNLTRAYPDAYYIGGLNPAYDGTGSLTAFGASPYDNFGVFPGNDDGAFAVKGAITVKPFEDAQLKVEGSYAFDPSRYSTIGLFSNVATIGNAQNSTPSNAQAVKYQIGAGYQQAFGKLAVAASGVYGETFDTFGPTGPTTNPASRLRTFGSGEYYKLVGNVGYQVTNNFSVLGEVSYANIDYDVGSADQTAGFVQFVRSF